MKALKLIVATLVIFGAGIVVGTLLESRRMAQARRTEIDRRGAVPLALWQRFETLRRAIRQLELSPEQNARVDGIIKDSHNRFQKLWEPMAPAARAELEQLKNRIAAELGPEKQAKFEEYLRQRTSRRSHAATNSIPAEPRSPQNLIGTPPTK
jgi:hypothetical protein